MGEKDFLCAFCSLGRFGSAQRPKVDAKFFSVISEFSVAKKNKIKPVLHPFSFYS